MTGACEDYFSKPKNRERYQYDPEQSCSDEGIDRQDVQDIINFLENDKEEDKDLLEHMGQNIRKALDRK